MVWKPYPNHVIFLRHIQHLQFETTDLNFFFLFNKKINLSPAILKLETLLYQNIYIYYFILYYIRRAILIQKKKWSKRKKTCQIHFVILFMQKMLLLSFYLPYVKFTQSRPCIGFSVTFKLVLVTVYSGGSDRIGNIKTGFCFKSIYEIFLKVPIMYGTSLRSFDWIYIKRWDTYKSVHNRESLKYMVSRLGCNPNPDP